MARSRCRSIEAEQRAVNRDRPNRQRQSLNADKEKVCYSQVRLRGFEWVMPAIETLQKISVDLIWGGC
jgi:hypothetical protein